MPCIRNQASQETTASDPPHADTLDDATAAVTPLRPVGAVREPITEARLHKTANERVWLGKEFFSQFLREQLLTIVGPPMLAVIVSVEESKDESTTTGAVVIKEVVIDSRRHWMPIEAIRPHQRQNLWE